MHLTMGTIGMLPIGVLKDLLVAAGLSVKVTPVKLIHGARLGVVTVTVDGPSFPSCEEEEDAWFVDAIRPG